MAKRIILGAILGALIAFVWGMISWTVLPFHEATIHHFNNESLMVETIKANVDVSGVYALPNLPKDLKSKTQEEQTTLINEFAEKYKAGPLVTTAVRLDGGDPSMVPQIMQDMVLTLVAGFVIALLLASVGCGGYICRVGFVGLIGFLIGWVGQGQQVIWFNFGLDYAALNLIDSTVAWTLAGFAMAAVIKKSSSA